MTGAPGASIASPPVTTWSPAFTPSVTSTKPGVRTPRFTLRRSALPAEGSSFVWVVAAGKADRRKVNLGVRTPGFVEVTDGVKAGEQVVTGGLAMRAPGAA